MPLVMSQAAVCCLIDQFQSSQVQFPAPVDRSPSDCTDIRLSSPIQPEAQVLLFWRVVEESRRILSLTWKRQDFQSDRLQGHHCTQIGDYLCIIQRESSIAHSMFSILCVASVPSLLVKMSFGCCDPVPLMDSVLANWLGESLTQSVL